MGRDEFDRQRDLFGEIGAEWLKAGDVRAGRFRGEDADAQDFHVVAPIGVGGGCRERESQNQSTEMEEPHEGITPWGGDAGQPLG